MNKNISKIYLSLLYILSSIGIAYLVYLFVLNASAETIEKEYPDGGGAAFIAFMAVLLIYECLVVPFISVAVTRIIYSISQKFTNKIIKLDLRTHLLIAAFSTPAFVFIYQIVFLLKLLFSPDYLDRSSVNFYQITFAILIPIFVGVIYVIWNLFLHIFIKIFAKFRNNEKS